MSKWTNIDGTDLKTLKQTRRALHQAIQLVSIFPRNILPHDPTDGTASLIWNKEAKSLQSIPVQNSNGLEVCTGLSLSNFQLYLSAADTKICSISMEGKSTNEGLAWLKEELNKLAFETDNLSLDLPYQIEDYDFSQQLSVDQKALNEFLSLYKNTNSILKKEVKKWEKAFDIRCWPHHFDLATLIPIEVDKAGEIVKSIGVGLSPGDESIDEPYLYVNVWPTVSEDSLNRHQLPSGHWNTKGWSGAVLTYSELLKQEDQHFSFTEFSGLAIQKILVELT